MFILLIYIKIESKSILDAKKRRIFVFVNIVYVDQEQWKVSTVIKDNVNAIVSDNVNITYKNYVVFII